MTEDPQVRREILSADAPPRIIRVAKSGFTWNLPRSFAGYFVDKETRGILGNAPKYIIRATGSDKTAFMVKYPQKFNVQETLTEFLINRLGREIGFEMAECGLIRIDGTLVFLTKIFTTEHEVLRHGSLMIEDCFKDEKALDRVRRKEEQQFYSIDFVVGVIREFVHNAANDFGTVFPKFVEMLVFDALVGSMDRHAQNWGVLETLTKPTRYRFAPIFDSARALLWNMSEERVSAMLADALDTRDTSFGGRPFRAYLERARPILGPKQPCAKRRCDHFEFIANLSRAHPKETARAVAKLPGDVPCIANRLLRRFPFQTAFSNRRKQLIVRILEERMRRLTTLLPGGPQ